MSDRSEQGQLIEAEQQRQDDVRLESALGAGCCPECGKPRRPVLLTDGTYAPGCTCPKCCPECGAPLRWGHIKIKWTIGARTFEMPCPMA